MLLVHSLYFLSDPTVYLLYKNMVKGLFFCVFVFVFLPFSGEKG